jgi:hypothetical protein
MRAITQLLLILSGCVVLSFHCGTSLNDPSDLAKGNGSGVGTGMVNGKLYKPDGKTRAQGAIVVIRYKNTVASINPGLSAKKWNAVHTTSADEDGIFSFDSVDTGLYVVEGADDKDNMILFDSIHIKTPDTVLNFLPDTLEPAGAIKGTIALINGGNPQQVFVLALGVDRFSQVKSDGTFLFTPLAAGSYKLKIISLDPQYGSIDTGNIVVKSRDTADIDTIVLPLRKLPVPEVNVRYDTLLMKATLTWRPTPAQITKGYNIYRVPINASDSQRTYSLTYPLNINTINSIPVLLKDTVFVDTFVWTSYPDLYVVMTENSSYDYYVSMVDSTDNEGAKSNACRATFISNLALYDSIQLNTSSFSFIESYTTPNNTDEFIVETFGANDGSRERSVYAAYSKGGSPIRSLSILKSVADLLVLPQSCPFDNNGNFYFLAWRLSPDSTFSIIKVLPSGELVDSLWVYKLLRNGGNWGAASIIVNNDLYFYWGQQKVVNKIDLQTDSLSVWKDLSAENGEVVNFLSDHNGGIAVVLMSIISETPSLWTTRILWYAMDGTLKRTFQEREHPGLGICFYGSLKAATESVLLFERGFCRIGSSGEIVSGRLPGNGRDYWIKRDFMSDNTIISSNYFPDQGKNRIYYCRFRK